MLATGRRELVDPRTERHSRDDEMRLRQPAALNQCSPSQGLLPTVSFSDRLVYSRVAIWQRTTYH